MKISFTLDTDGIEDPQVEEATRILIRNITDNFEVISTNEARIQAQEKVVTRMIRQGYDLQGQSYYAVMGKIERYGLDKLVYEMYFLQNITAIKVAEKCNEVLDGVGHTDVRISKNNIYNWLKIMKKRIERERPTNQNGLVNKALQLLDRLNHVVEILDEHLIDFLDNGGLLDHRIDRTGKIFYMWKESVKELANLITNKLPPPPINIETLKINLFNVLQTIENATFTDNETKIKFIQLIKSEVIDNIQFVTEVSELNVRSKPKLLTRRFSG